MYTVVAPWRAPSGFDGLGMPVKVAAIDIHAITSATQIRSSWWRGW